MSRPGSRRWSRTPFELTERQVEVLRLIGEGYSNSEIAGRLGMTLDGAKFHVSEILAKLAVSTREEAVAAWKTRRREVSAQRWQLGLKWVAVFAAAAGTVGIAAGIWTLANRDGEDSPAATEPTPALSAVVQPAPFQCPPPRTPTPTLEPGVRATPRPPSDGPSGVFFNSRYYPVSGNATVPASLIGPQYGEVCYDNYPNPPAPGDVTRDGDARALDIGTRFFTVVGYRPEFRLAMLHDGVYYLAEAMMERPRTAQDVLDLRGKVARVDVTRESESAPPSFQLVASITGATEVERLTEWLLASPWKEPPQNDSGAYRRLIFVMKDGTTVDRGYYPATGFVEWFDVPAEFEAAIAEAERRSTP